MSRRNPRKNVPEDKFCSFIYPEDYKDPTKVGQRCGSMHMKDSEFCYFHQTDQTAVREQLSEAREKVEYKTQTKHGIYQNPARRKCDSCTFAEGCEHFEAGKKVCDYSVSKKVDLSTLESIAKFTEQIMTTESDRYTQLEVLFAHDPENLELYDLSSRNAKRMLSIAKDYAAIKATYEKNKTVTGWKDLL